MSRKLWPFVLFALVSVTLALIIGLYTQREARGGEAFAQYDPKNVRKLVLSGPGRNVELLPLSINSAWITVTELGKSEQFLAGSGTRDIWFSLSPMWATRVLGKWSKKKSSEYGFQSPETSFRIESMDGNVHEYRVGARGFQSSDYFVFNKARNTVFLWNRETIDIFKDPARIAMKKLEFLHPDTLNAILIKDDIDPYKSLELIKNSKIWAIGNRPVEADAPILSWLARLSNASIAGYRKSKSEGVKPLMRMAFDIGTRIDLKIFYDEKAKLYALNFGPDKPDLLLKSGEFEPLKSEWDDGKIHLKN